MDENGNLYTKRINAGYATFSGIRDALNNLANFAQAAEDIPQTRSIKISLLKAIQDQLEELTDCIALIADNEIEKIGEPDEELSDIPF